MVGSSFRPRLTRRQVVTRVAAGATAGIAGTSLLPGILQARRAPALIQSGGKLTFWGGLIFSDAANELLTNTVNDWGSANSVETEVVMINQNETNQKVSAAVESNTMPDVLDLGLDLMLLLSQTDKLTAVDDLFTRIGDAQGGWMDAIASATDPAKFGGARLGIPFGASGNLLFARQDVLDGIGVSDLPTTWEDLTKVAKDATSDGIYGMGFALSNVGDGNLQTSVLQSYGGRIADDEGKTVTLKSPETTTYMEWVKAAWDNGLFPPGATTWDGAGDNTAYLSGQVVFIANTGSVSIKAQTDDPELYDTTSYASLPAGPVMKVSSVGPNLRAIPVSTKDVDTAKALVEHLSNADFLNEYYKVAIYGPVLKGQESMEAFSDPIHAGLLDLVKTGTAPGAPDVNNAAYADFNSNFLVPKMVQRVVIDGKTIEEAIDEAQKQGEAIYAKYA